MTENFVFRMNENKYLKKQGKFDYFVDDDDEEEESNLVEENNVHHFREGFKKKKL